MMRFRKGWFGRMVLQVCDWNWACYSPGERNFFWRDARMSDFIMEPDGTLRLNAKLQKVVEK